MLHILYYNNCMSNKLKGKLGEQIARDYLIKKGYEILDTNFRYSRYGEIDIIAFKNSIICFVEVKYRTSNTFGTPLEAITKSKLEKIQLSANYYLSQTKKKFKSYRIEALSILDKKGEFEINHIENIQF